ncbi:MAG: tetratricopeptide repeat protein, partial [Bacteroidaceae bacterium]|nr:tetratricopeptide repeat protein [Bacteroidaceae bacterium]
MKTIKVFIASSEELGQERLEIGDLFAHLNSIFKRRGIVLEVSKWEYLDESMGSLRKQDEYNREIKTCDMCMVLYWKRLGEFTREELETAYTELQAGRKPYRLYIYFKEVGEITQEMKSFKDRFYPKYGHFYGKFENSDTLKLRFLLQLEGYISSGAVKVENSQIMVDTIPVASLDNIPFAAQNAHYKDLKERLAKIEDDIKAFEAVLAVQANETIRDLLNTKKSERHKLQEELSSHEQSLFNTAVRVAKFAGEKISERMQRAIAMFEEGKVAEANTLLDDAECEADAALSRYKQTKELLASERETLICSIEELLLKTSVMLADTSIAAEERVSRTAEIYEKASSLARECDYDKEKFAKLLEKKSDFLIEHALYSEAQVVNDEWLSLCKEHLGEKHVSTAASYNNIGVAYYSLGDYDKALEYYNRAHDIRLDVLGENHPGVAASYSNIGVAYYSLGDYDKALEYYNKALGIQLNVLGENHSGVATSYNNIGLAYYSLGDYDNALEYHNKAHDIRLDVLGENHPDVAASYNNIGMAYYNLGDYDKALEYLNKALGIQLNVLGENHSGVATSYNNIGLAYYSLGDYDKALEYYNKALGIQLNVLG